MYTASKLALGIFALMALVSTGCTGICRGPIGCSSCGPISVGCRGCDSCDGCDGCGELYIDPWINHPPSCNDPCDSCGNFNGQSCGQCRPIFSGHASLWGYRCGDDGDKGFGGSSSCGCGVEACGGCDAPCGGCDSCGPAIGGQPGCSSCQASTTYESDGVIISGQPTVTDDIISESARPPYQPHRTRKIFNPKARVAER